MTAVNQDLEQYISTDFTISVTTRIGEDGPRKDITGATISWSVARDNESSAEFTLTTTAGDISITTAASGEFDIDVSASDTSGLEAGDYYHECELVESGGNESVLFTGTLTLNSRIT